MSLRLVQQSGQYRGEILGADGKLGKLELIDFDAVHDLALVKSTCLNRAHLNCTRVHCRPACGCFPSVPVRFGLHHR